MYVQIPNEIPHDSLINGSIRVRYIARTQMYRCYECTRGATPINRVRRGFASIVRVRRVHTSDGLRFCNLTCDLEVSKPWALGGSLDIPRSL